MAKRPAVLAAAIATLALSLSTALAAGAPSKLALPLFDENGRLLGSRPDRVPTTDSVIQSAPSDATAGRFDSGTPRNVVASPTDQVIPDDLIVSGSGCVGFDCLTDGTENFGFDTIRLKENNLQIKFEDTSASAGFPSNDWTLRANESANGGRNAFFLDDATGGTTPLTVMAGAPTNAVNVSASGRVGFGIADPVTTLHSFFRDTPTLRLDQSSAAGWAPYTWDVAGNEANFFVRDVTGGSTLPFRVMPGTRNNMVVVAPSGVGILTTAPQALLHIKGNGSPLILAQANTGGTAMSLDDNGNMVLSGVLLESSSRTVKENLTPVDPDQVLDRVGKLDLYEWSYRADAPTTRHIGPVAEDFAELFEVGADNRHISALDASGVALSAIQALDRKVREKDARIADLESRLGEEQARIQELSRRLEDLDRRMSAK